MLVNADLHIHSKYSMGSSKEMNLANISRESKKKGIQLLGTGDCLHPKWMAEIKAIQVSDGLFEREGIHYILSTEVEDNRRIHHLLFFPDVAKVAEFREHVKPNSSGIDRDGRAKLRLSGWEIAEAAKDAGALIGPCHAFTPWTGIYGVFDSIADCYKDLTPYIKYLELGLSAESAYADRIEELLPLTFLTNSDAHSPYPLKIAREFNRIDLSTLDFAGLKRAFEKTNEKRFKLNVGMPPEEGKYNETACICCFTHYSLKQAVANKFKCTKCKKRIKKGVKDRVNELAKWDTPHTPAHRPPYLKIVPLAEIIAKALGLESTNSKKVAQIWEALIAEFGSEVDILVDRDLKDMSAAPEPVLEAIRAFRENKVRLIPGGGGQYGKIELPNAPETTGTQRKDEEEDPGPESEAEAPIKKKGAQSSLFDF